MVPSDLPPGQATLELPTWFVAIAYFTFGGAGALAGMQRGYDIIGVLLMALITAVGGGLIRDGILISSGPASILTNSSMLWVVLAAAGVTFAFQRQVQHFRRAVALIDALGLGAFAVYGAQRSLNAGLSSMGAVMGGTITAVGGGLLRDLLAGDEPLLLKPGQFYALVAIGGCCLYIGLPRLGWVTQPESAYITVVTVFVLRLLAIRFNWRTTALRAEPAAPRD